MVYDSEHEMRIESSKLFGIKCIVKIERKKERDIFCVFRAIDFRMQCNFIRAQD